MQLSDIWHAAWRSCYIYCRPRDAIEALPLSRPTAISPMAYHSGRPNLSQNTTPAGGRTKWGDGRATRRLEAHNSPPPRSLAQVCDVVSRHKTKCSMSRPRRLLACLEDYPRVSRLSVGPYIPSAADKLQWTDGRRATAVYTTQRRRAPAALYCAWIMWRIGSQNVSADLRRSVL